jgi:Zn-dependent protease
MSASVGEYVAYLLYALPGLIIGFVVHELAHALVAVRLGDPTPRRMGRLTLSPAQHIDPLGFGMLITVGFGWAKPVVFSTSYIRTAGQQALVAAAGPLSNLVLAGIFGLGMRLVLTASPDLPLRIGDAYTTGSVQLLTFGHGGADLVLYLFLAEAFFVNIILFVFNLIPIPPLDGYTVARGLLGHVIPAVFDVIDRNRQYVYLIALVVLVAIPLASSGQNNPLGSAIVNVNDSFYNWIVGSPPFAGTNLPRLTMLFSTASP